ncbi:MAG: sarcosine oxidase subunit alpha family protein [Xanthobacteraceae bacterium]
MQNSDASTLGKTSATSRNRLPHGGLIDRTTSLRFSFDGRGYVGHPGDTLASALIANGVSLVGRSFKYHRPRGIFSAGSDEPNALVELRDGTRREPNTRATTIELFDGLTAASQNRWPSLAFDVMSINDVLSPFFPAGFYYKTFMWPPAFWEKVYEPAIRRTAGLGRAAGADDPDEYEKAFAHCDVLVVGSGPAGLMAALSAGRAGARVILAEEDFKLGGRLLAERFVLDESESTAWAARIEAELAAMPEVTIMRRTTVFGVYDHGQYGAVERVSDHLAVPPPYQPRQRYWKIVAKRALLAAGASERPIAFEGNDRPGVMLAGAVRTYLNRYATTPSSRLVVFTNNDDGWRTASAAQDAGVAIEAIVDSRADARERLPTSLKKAVRIFAGARVVRTKGTRAVRAVEIIDVSGRRVTVSCDCLGVAGGWNPLLHLTCHLGGKPQWRDDIAAFVPNTLPHGMIVAGAADGAMRLADCLTTGSEAGARAASDCGYAAAPAALPRAADETFATAPVWWVNGKGKAFVDLQNDVTVKDVELAKREGFQSVEHLKRYTTLGMATDQGKIGGVVGLAVMAELTKRPISEVGTTTYRPPYTPVTLGALAGHHRGKDFRPTRLSPSHQWALEQGAVMVETGAWLRAQYYPRAGEADWLETVSHEVRTVRSAVGVCDVSTLGRIDVQGSDAGIFLDRIYTNMFSSLPVGKARYGLMLREDGFVMDDGTTSRLSPDHYFMTTTTANAGKVMQHLEFCHQVLWPDLDVQMVSVSEQWAQYSIAGPRSRDTLRKLVDAQHSLSNEAFPHLAARPVTIFGGLNVLLFRLSFSGELAYELAVPARYGDAVIRAVMAAGEEFEIAPYGTEALGVMRIEKGHVSTNEINGQTTAHDLGAHRMLSARKDFIGRVMAERAALQSSDRPIFVGFKPADRAQRLRAGAYFLPLGAQTVADNDQGHMTSVAFSPTLGHWVGLGLLQHGPRRFGERVRAYDPVRDGDVEVEVCDPIFIDAERVRLHG